MLVSDAILSFKRYALHERGMRPKSYKSIIASLNRLTDWAETGDLTQLNHGTVKAFLYWGREERLWEARTFRNHRQYLKSFFDWALGQGHIQTNPIDGILKPKLPQRVPRSLSREQITTVLNAIRWYPWRYKFEVIRNETIIYLLVYTGIRLQEMLNLETMDVCLESHEILIREGKGRKDRLIPIHPRLAPVLQKYLTEKQRRRMGSRHFITAAQSAKPLSGKDVRAICQWLARETGIFFTPHWLRHTFGRLMVEADFDIYKIKEVMGHSNILTTERYLSVSPENIKRGFRETSLL